MNTSKSRIRELLNSPQGERLSKSEPFVHALLNYALADEPPVNSVEEVEIIIKLTNVKLPRL
jgi:hypothetical protein